MGYIKIGQGVRIGTQGGLPKEISEQRPEEGKEVTYGGAWSMNVSGRGHGLCKGTEVGEI